MGERVSFQVTDAWRCQKILKYKCNRPRTYIEIKLIANSQGFVVRNGDTQMFEY